MKHSQEPTDALLIAKISPSCTSLARGAMTRILPATTMRLGVPSLVPLAAAAVASITLGTRAQAQCISPPPMITLTAYGSAPPPTGLGLTLTTFASGFVPTGGSCVGPVGIVPLQNGTVLVTEANGNLDLFPNDVDGQTWSAPLQLNNFTLSNAVGLGVLIGSTTKYYMTRDVVGQVVQIDPNTGTIIATVATGIFGAIGICGFPPAASFPGAAAHTGHLFVSTESHGIWEVNPSPPVTLSQVSVTNVDGIVFTKSGQYLMGVDSIGLRVFDLTQLPLLLSPVYTVPITLGDGIALGQGTALAGKAYVNTNDGNLWEVVYDIDPSNGNGFNPPPSPIVNLVATGGSRGDFIAVDIHHPCAPSGPNGQHWPSMLITQSDRIVRIDPPDGGWFGPPFSVMAVINDNQSFCAGDGTLATPCPCFNFGLPGQGCDNSIGTGGALLSVTGSTMPDTMVLLSAGELPSVTSVFLQGTADIANGVVFGDGVRCAGGSLKRLAVKNAVNGAVLYPNLNDLSISARSAQLGDPIASGSSRYYQVYYRDPVVAFCGPPSSTFNVSSAIRIDW